MRGQSLAARTDAAMARRRRQRQPAVLGCAGHIFRRRLTLTTHLRRGRLPNPTSSMSKFRRRPYPLLMNVGSDVAAGVAVGHPRRAVIEQAWRAIGPGVDVLSSEDGGPLSRTVKRIIDPLVLRLRANPQYSLPVVNPETAAAIHDLIVGNGPELCAAAAWFETLKLERRRLRIRTGNAQELYFPVCFELAVTKGAPVPHDHQTAAAVLQDIHQGRDRTAIEASQQHVARPDVVAVLADQPRPQLARRAARRRCDRSVHGRARHRAGTRHPQQAHRSHRAPTSLVRRDRRRHAVQPGRPGPRRRRGAALVDRRDGAQCRCAPTAAADHRRCRQRSSAGPHGGRPGARHPAPRHGPRRPTRHTRNSCAEEVDRACRAVGAAAGGQAGDAGRRDRRCGAPQPVGRTIGAALSAGRNRSRPGCARRPMSCMHGAIWPASSCWALCTRASSR